MKYNPGTINTPKIVPNNIPPAAAAPIVLLPIAPGPVANTSGINPAINAKDVINIGRRRAAAPSIADCNGVLPASFL